MGNGLERGCLQHSSRRPSEYAELWLGVTQTQTFQLTLKNSAVKPSPVELCGKPSRSGQSLNFTEAQVTFFPSAS